MIPYTVREGENRVDESVRFTGEVEFFYRDTVYNEIIRILEEVVEEAGLHDDIHESIDRFQHYIPKIVDRNEWFINHFEPTSFSVYMPREGGNYNVDVSGIPEGEIKRYTFTNPKANCLELANECTEYISNNYLNNIHLSDVNIIYFMFDVEEEALGRLHGDKSRKFNLKVTLGFDWNE